MLSFAFQFAVELFAHFKLHFHGVHFRLTSCYRCGVFIIMSGRQIASLLSYSTVTIPYIPIYTLFLFKIATNYIALEIPEVEVMGGSYSYRGERRYLSLRNN